VKVRERYDLQRLLRSQIEVLGEDIYVLTEEFGDRLAAGICFRARRIGNGHNADGCRGVRGSGHDRVWTSGFAVSESRQANPGIGGASTRRSRSGLIWGNSRSLTGSTNVCSTVVARLVCVTGIVVGEPP